MTQRLIKVITLIHGSAITKIQPTLDNLKAPKLFSILGAPILFSAIVWIKEILEYILYKI